MIFSVFQASQSGTEIIARRTSFSFPRKHTTSRDLAIHAMYQLSVYGSEKIGRVFGKGYTAVTAAVKRARKYLEENSRLELIIKKILDDL